MDDLFSIIKLVFYIAVGIVSIYALFTLLIPMLCLAVGYLVYKVLNK